MPSNAKKRWQNKKKKETIIRDLTNDLLNKAIKFSKREVSSWKPCRSRTCWVQGKCLLPCCSCKCRQCNATSKYNFRYQSKIKIKTDRSFFDKVESNLNNILEIKWKCEKSYLSHICRISDDVSVIHLTVNIKQPFFERYGCDPQLPKGHTSLLKEFEHTFNKKVSCRSKEGVRYTIQLSRDVINIIGQYICPTLDGFNHL